jgi:pilus assembly protein CpaF
MTNAFLTEEEKTKRARPKAEVSAEDTESLYQKAKDAVSDTLKGKLGDRDKVKVSNAGPEVTAMVQEIARRVYHDFNEQAFSRRTTTLPMSAEEFVTKIEYDILGMGPLEPLLRDSTVEDIVINGHKEVQVKRMGKRWEHTDIQWGDEKELIELINRGIADSGNKVNPTEPVANGIFPGGERVSVAIDPVSSFPVVSIRCHRAHSITFKEMVDQGVISQAAADYFCAAIVAGLNIVFVGATGTGKTTMINAAGLELKTNPKTKDYRMIVIENTREINILPESELPQNIVYLVSRPESMDKKIPAVTEAELVMFCLRQRPQALTLGEARGEEILPLIQALSTGHRNGMTSIHANSIQEAFDRILVMMNMSEQGRKLGENRVAKLVGLAFNILVFIKTDRTSKVGRAVQSICEYTGRVVNDENKVPAPELVTIFDRKKGVLEGPLRSTYHESRFREDDVDPTPFLVPGGDK